MAFWDLALSPPMTERGQLGMLSKLRVSNSNREWPEKRPTWEAHMKSIVKKSKVYGVSAAALGACALGAFAIGTVALGALALGRLAIGRLVLGKGTLRSLHVREISVDRLKVGDVEVARTLKLPPAVGQRSPAQPFTGTA